jgi:lipopolysaccharide/colanic/teichoic acid biosynthesis glycosyltransferase
MYLFIKKVTDFVVSMILAILITPILIVIALILGISLKGNPLFFQDRAGYKGKKFKVMKFRTMNNNRGVNGELLPDNERLTLVGKKIRSLSLDELPQLFNVIKGEMSFIGPRPFMYEYIYLYTEEEKRRHDARPGITGWAQVNGRNSLSWKEKFKLDLYYIDRIGLLIDLKILLMTFMKVLKLESVDQGQDVTMEKYDGTN